jgi:hypothetical protein
MNSLEPEDKLSAVLSSFWEEIFPKVEAYTIPITLKRIQSWVGEQPEMTEALCSCIVQNAFQFNGINGKSNEKEVKLTVDHILQKEFVQNWQSSPAASHLQNIQTALLEFYPRDSLLILYIQILQRGKMPVGNSPEQSALVEAGLVKVEGDYLKIANPVYAKVFDLDWVEKQVPGITKPFVIVDLAKTRKGIFSGSRLYSKIAAVAIGLAILGAAISSYIRETNGLAIAESDAVLDSGSQPKSTAAKEEKSLGNAAGNATAGAVKGNVDGRSAMAEPSKGIASGRTLFDTGAEHAQNSRWVPMMRDFCSLSESSVYFAPAQKRLEQWSNLYPEDIEMARNIVAQEQAAPCAIAKNVLSAEAN